jgi:hypothetical protein
MHQNILPSQLLMIVKSLYYFTMTFCNNYNYQTQYFQVKNFLNK